MTLTPCTDLSAASWITGSDQPWSTLVGFGPAGFPAYARLRLIPDPTAPGQRESDVDAPDGPTPTEQLRVVLDTLRHHTGTPDRCYFALWDGWGELHGSDGGAVSVLVSGPARPGAVPRIPPAFGPEVLDGPQVHVPNRDYYLFEGTLDDLGDWGASDLLPGTPRTLAEPAFVWPADRAWCVAKDVDPHWAGIGASASAVDQLVADPRVDVVAADPDLEQPHYS